MSFSQDVQEKQKASQTFFDKYDIEREKLIYITDEGATESGKADGLSSIAYFTLKDSFISCHQLSEANDVDAKKGFTCDTKGFKWQSIVDQIENKGKPNPFYNVIFRKTINDEKVNIDQKAHNSFVFYIPKAESLVDYDKFFEVLSELEEGNDFKFWVVHIPLCE